MIKVYIYLVMQTYLLGQPATVVVAHPTMASCQQQLIELANAFPGHIESITCEVVDKRKT